MPSIDISDTKEVDPIAKAKMIEAQTMLKAELNTLELDLDDLTNKKKQGGTFNKIMGQYAKPVSLVVFGILGAVVFAVVSTFFGYFIMETMNQMNKGWVCREKPEFCKGDEDFGKGPWELALPYCLIMFGASFLILISKSLSGILLTRVSENITGAVRKDLYESILRKDIGWHDHRDNSAGIMTGTLASDVQLLNGVSSEGMGA